jgi:hypothetical protein
MATAWYIWTIRRQKVHVVPLQTLIQSMMSINVFVTNFVRAANLNDKKNNSSWTKSKEGSVTPNVDARFFLDQRKASTGAVTRDDTGSIITKYI